ncbi:MAG: prepilin-type N-terminal cleavage/methylation domain-containing protein [Gammaproteobacteria bacterium]|nr:prepilin-type N-terminal cleavage/methylation domain-containing protein [Gammaproteobacteria bacterium]
MHRMEQQRGMTLIELMVAMSIGLFLTGGALYIYSQSKNTYRASDSIARLQESARFALDTIEPDIRLARYWGRNAEPAMVTVPAGIVVPCSSSPDVAAWVLDIGTAIEISDDTYDLPCSAFSSSPRAGSDVLTLRHAEPWTGGTEPAPEAGRLQVQTSLAEGRLFNDGAAPDLGAESTTHNVVLSAYYVNARSSFDASQPSLRRLTLRANGSLGEDEVIPGVENLQVQLGIDTNRDGGVDRYVDGDDPLVTADAAIVAVRLWMLVGTPADDPAWSDTASYPTPDADLGNLVGGSDGYPAGVRRVQISKTIYLNNQGS